MVLPHKQAHALRELQGAIKTHRQAARAKYQAEEAFNESNKRLTKAKLEFERTIYLTPEEYDDYIRILS